MSIKTKKWIKCALIRAVRTMAQTAVSMLTVDMAGILEVDWIALLSASALAGLVSILTSLSGIPEAKEGVE